MARLLVAGAGVSRHRLYPDGEELFFRTYASAGALYPVEVYAVCSDLSGLPAGVYHFEPRSPALERLREGDHRGHLLRAAGEKPAVAEAPTTLVLTGIPRRSTWKYTERGYRHLFWDAGMILANLLALATGAARPAEVPPADGPSDGAGRGIGAPRADGPRGGQSPHPSERLALRRRAADPHRVPLPGLLHCGMCGLRMWGNRRPHSRYYSCQPSHQRSANIPADHAAHIYLNEAVLHEAAVGFLSTAVFGPDRASYWERCLDAAAAPEPAAPLADRLRELEAEVADLERRLYRQVANLEADDVSSALRQRVSARVGELKAAIEDRRDRVQALRDQMAEAPAAPTEVAAALDRLPLLADRLAVLPQRELRALFDALQLKLVYQPAEHAIDVELTLVGGDKDASSATENAEVWSVPPGGVGPDLRRMVRLRQRLRLRLKRPT